MIEIGWFVDVDIGEVVFDSPVPLKEVLPVEAARSPVATCPAIGGLRKRLYCLRAPFSFMVSLHRGLASSSLVLHQSASSIAAWKAREWIRLMQASEWPSRDRPVVQVFLPYTFVTDADLMVRQVPPHQHYFGQARPGIVLAGEFAFRNWPRPLSWAFEFHDASKPLRVRRGEPLCYVEFAAPEGESVHLKRVPRTAAIQDQQKRIGGVTALVRNTLRFTDVAGENRPQHLMPDAAFPAEGEPRE
jgi:hypothetical protein